MKESTFLLILITGFMLTACYEKDACLDSGGRYNETTQQCEK